jgi:outer membrane receptor protein involved in Fe transport
VPGAIVGLLAQVPPQFGGPIRLPRTASTYLNLGPLRQRGLELSLDQRINNAWTLSANYSYQDKPEPLTPDQGQLPYLNEEVGLPAKNRFNAAVNWNEKRFLGNVSVNYVDKALWTDVLTSQYHGFTDAYTMVNASFGVKWQAGKVVTTVKAMNILNETIQQHVFGDVIKRSVLGELRLTF